MRRCGAVVMVVVFGAVIAAILWTIGPRPSTTPSVALTLVGYTNSAHFLVAQVSLTNAGRTAVSYEAWGPIPYGWVKAQTATGWTNTELAPNFTGGTVVVLPGACENFRVVLPAATLRWQCGFSVRRATIRERAASIILSSRLPYRVYPVCEWFLGFLPNRLPSEQDFDSEVFQVSPPAHNVRSGVAAGRALLFAFRRLWPGTTHRGC
jgi:hypothetical protein